MENKSNIIISSLIVIILIFSISFYLFISFVSLPQKEKEIEELNQYIEKFKDDDYENKMIEVSNAIKYVNDYMILLENKKNASNFLNFFESWAHPGISYNINLDFSYNKAMARGVTDNVVKLMEQIAILGIQEKIKEYEISDVDIAIDGKTQFNLTFYFSEELIK